MKETAKEKIKRMTKLLDSEIEMSRKEVKRYKKEEDFINALRAKEYIFTCNFFLTQIENDGEL